MTDYSEIFVGIDTSKLKNAVAIAEGGRHGEIRYLGEPTTAVPRGLNDPVVYLAPRVPGPLAARLRGEARGPGTPSTPAVGFHRLWLHLQQAEG